MSDWAQLTAALRERGFGITHNVRLTGFGDRKISVIKTVRELTSWGLKDSKDAVEGLATIVDSLALDAAERTAEELQTAGATVEIGVDELHLYAFDLDHSLRGGQPLERVRVVGSGFALERGKLGDWTPAAIEPLDLDSMLDALDEHRRRWAAAGKREATGEQEIHALTSAREHSLEARLRDSDDEARVREAAVYGDWLQAQGDPRGLIAAASLSLIEAGDVAALRDERQRELDRLAFEHSSHLFGPARGLMDSARWTWQGPMLDTLAIEHPRLKRPGVAHRPPTCSQMIALLGAPVCACLRSLALEEIDRELLLGDVLNTAACASSLRELRLRSTMALRLHGDAFTRLQALTLAGRFTLGPARLPALRKLDLEIFPVGPLGDSFVELDTPALEEFTIRLSTHDYWEQHYGPLHSALFELLSQPAFAKLRSLTLATEPLQAGFASLLARLPAIATLEGIDLREAEMTADCRTELERSRDRLPGLLL